MEIVSIAVILVITAFTSPLISCGVDKLFGTHYSCKFFGWHNGDLKGNAGVFDGCSYHAKCSKCKKEVMQDGQGNWF